MTGKATSRDNHKRCGRQYRHEYPDRGERKHNEPYRRQQIFFHWFFSPPETSEFFHSMARLETKSKSDFD
jgi:hypothetical protein